MTTLVIQALSNLLLLMHGIGKKILPYLKETEHNDVSAKRD